MQCRCNAFFAKECRCNAFFAKELCIPSKKRYTPSKQPFIPSN